MNGEAEHLTSPKASTIPGITLEIQTFPSSKEWKEFRKGTREGHIIHFLIK